MPFVKGQSGNPSGRPKEDSEIKELAKAQGPAAIKRLVKWMRSDNPKASVSAANVLLDRGYGKPAQGVVVGGDPDNPVIHKIERVIVNGAVEKA